MGSIEVDSEFIMSNNQKIHYKAKKIFFTDQENELINLTDSTTGEIFLFLGGGGGGLGYMKVIHLVATSFE